jgi:hypothetical protein
MAREDSCDQLAGILFLLVLLFIQVGPFYYLIKQGEAQL